MNNGSLLIVGSSEKVEAEYSYTSKEYPFTVLEMFDKEPVGTEGFKTLEEARKSVLEAKEFGVTVYDLGE